MLIALLLLTSYLSAQTKPSQIQLSGIRSILPPGEGVVVQTQNGLKTVFPIPGFAYVAGGTTVQLLTSLQPEIKLSEVPVRQPDGRYLLNVRPNPAIIAVYRNGLRVHPNKYRLIWLDKNELPDRFEIDGSTESDEVVVDYVVGATQYPPE